MDWRRAELFEKFNGESDNIEAKLRESRKTSLPRRWPQLSLFHSSVEEKMAIASIEDEDIRARATILGKYCKWLHENEMIVELEVRHSIPCSLVGHVNYADFAAH